MTLDCYIAKALPVNYHVSISRKCMGVNGEALQLHSVIKSCIFDCKSRENPYQVLQVACTASERAMKSKVCMIKSL